MTKRGNKRVIPAKASLTPEVDAKFEEMLSQDLRRLSPSALGPDSAFWKVLPAAHPSTRRRLLIQYLNACVRANAAPARLAVDKIAAELGTSETPRARRRNPDQIRAMARFLVRNPEASLAQLAEAMGDSTKRTTASSVWRLFLGHCPRAGVPELER